MTTDALAFFKTQQLVKRITANVMGVEMRVVLARDKRDPERGRLYLQVQYEAPDENSVDQLAHCTWSGRKWYLSEHMLDDEVVKTAYLAVRTAVEHEVLEGFRVDGLRLFNPHTPFTELMQGALVEVKRKQKTDSSEGA